MREITVVVRARPLPPSDPICCIVISSEDGLVLVGNEKLYKFDAAFDWITEQEKIYAACVSRPLAMLLSGSNSSVIVYGQTGSGVTYTMGTDIKNSEPIMRGIIPRLLQNLFSNISTEVVSVSFLEISSGELYDLFGVNGRQLIEVDNQADMLKVIEETSVHVDNLENALLYFEKGCRLRTSKETLHNSQSSVSDVVFTVFLKNYQDNGSTVTSKMHLVEVADLDGVGKLDGEMGEQTIRKLMDIDEALSTSSGKADKQSHQSSVFGHVLKDCTREDDLAVVIACISSAKTDMKETVKTLRFANHLRKTSASKVKPLAEPKTQELVLKDNPFRSNIDELPPTPASWHQQDLTAANLPQTACTRSSSKFSESSILPLSHSATEETTTKQDSDVFKVPPIPPIKHSNRKSSLAQPFRHSSKRSLETSFQYVLSPDANENCLSACSSRSFCSAEGMSLSPVVDKVCNTLEKSMIERLEGIEDRVIQRLSRRPFGEQSQNIGLHSTVCASSASELRSILDKIYESMTACASESKGGSGNAPMSPSSRKCSPPQYRRRSIRIQNQQEKNFVGPTAGTNKENVVHHQGKKRKSPKTDTPKKSKPDLPCNVDFHQKHVANLLNILNNGSVNSLQCLPRIGPKTAQIIFTWRQLQGQFNSISELQNVRGLPRSFYSRFAAANLLE